VVDLGSVKLTKSAGSMTSSVRTGTSHIVLRERNFKILSVHTMIVSVSHFVSVVYPTMLVNSYARIGRVLCLKHALNGSHTHTIIDGLSSCSFVGRCITKATFDGGRFVSVAHRFWLLLFTAVSLFTVHTLLTLQAVSGFTVIVITYLNKLRTVDTQLHFLTGIVA